ncbi:hypothetical protein WICMUC_001845 [Wickerhamomyces mucosus]|uniref:Protein HGH1 homolog n=1 Tax=Wickerhamomyces mucosus TaxID=1378264 RepID=A0A9P8TFV8_9ASCO|nr:hypothetical protein WICMUC_001845 [Wickerhamomyces mucosus]
MPSELEELTQFLHHPQPPVRTVAIQNLIGYSVGPQASVFKYDNFLPIKDLKVLARDKGRAMVQQALTCLVNLSQDLEIRDLIANDDSFMKHLISIIIDLESINSDLASILLANIAKNSNIKRIFEWEIEPHNKDVFKSTKVVDCLLDVFVKGSDRKLNKVCNYDYLSFFFADFTRFVNIRKYFVTKQNYDGVVPISKILVFTEKYDSKIRREGVASTIKNSLFEITSHEELIDENLEVNILPYLLLPIATSKDANLDEEELFNLPDELQLLDEDKVRDPIPEIICNHLESILLLCTTKTIRELLRKKSVYPLVRELHKNIDNENIQDLCDRIVQMLMRDENNVEIEEIPEKLDEEDEEENDRIHNAILDNVPLEGNEVEKIEQDDDDYESDGDDEIMEIV